MLLQGSCNLTGCVKLENDNFQGTLVFHSSISSPLKKSTGPLHKNDFLELDRVILVVIETIPQIERINNSSVLLQSNHGHGVMDLMLIDLDDHLSDKFPA